MLAAVTNVKTLIFPAAWYNIDRVKVGEVLRANNTLEKVTFALSQGLGEAWASALGVRFEADSSSSSVGLRINEGNRLLHPIWKYIQLFLIMVALATVCTSFHTNCRCIQHH